MYKVLLPTSNNRKLYLGALTTRGGMFETQTQPQFELNLLV